MSQGFKSHNRYGIHRGDEILFVSCRWGVHNLMEARIEGRNSK